MQDYPLTISSIMRHGTQVFGTAEVATYTGEGMRRTSYAELGRRAARLDIRLCARNCSQICQPMV